MSFPATSSYPGAAAFPGSATYPVSMVWPGGTVFNPPATPTNLSAEPGDTTVLLICDTVAGATGYRLYRDGVLIFDYPAPGWGDTGLTNGTEYSYTVSATNAGGESAQSSPVTATPGAAVDFVRTYSIGSAGTVVSAANLSAASHGLSGTWSPSRVPMEHTILSSAAIVRGSPLILGGVGYDGTGAKSIKFDLDAAIVNNSTPLYEQLTWDVTSTETEISLSALVKFNTTAGADTTAIDVFTIYASAFAVMQFKQSAAGAMSLNAHGQFGGSTGGWAIPITANTLYSITLRKSSLSEYCELAVCDAVTGAFVGVSRCKAGAGTFTSAILGQSYLNFYGGYYEIGLTALAVGPNAIWPLGEPNFAVPDPASVAATQPSNSTVRVGWGADPSRAYTWLVERNKDSGGWTTLFADWEATYPENNLFILDTDVIDGSVCQYRLTAKVGALVSGVVLSNTITVSNSSGSFLVDEGFEGTGTPSGWFPFGTVDFDYASSPIVGSQSLQIDGSAALAFVQFPVADVGPELFARLRVRNIAADTSVYYLLLLEDSGSATAMQVLRLSDGTLSVQDSSGFVSEVTVAAMADGVNYVWFHYQPAANSSSHDGVVRVWHSSSSTRPGNGSNNSAGATNARGVNLIDHAKISVGAGQGVWVFDDVKASNSDF